MSAAYDAERGRWRAGGPVRRERHFGDRVLPCIAGRPAGPWDAFARAVAERPDAEALVAGELRLSYAALDRRAARAAAGLAACGVGRGDRVAMWLGNSADFVVVLLAVLRLGAVAVPMGTRLQAPEVAYIVGHSGAAVLVHDAALEGRLPAADEVPGLRHRLAAGAAGGIGDEAGDGGGAPPDLPPAPAGEDEACVILYTSGTTGRPKGAVLAGLNLVHSMLNYMHCMGIGPADRTLMAVPASHVTGLVANIMLAWAARCALVVMAEFRVRDFLALAAGEGMTHTVMVPAMYALCLLQPDFGDFDLSAWRAGGYGGAPMAESTIAALAARLPGLGLHNVYGSTETASPVTMLPRHLAAERPDSVGLALPCAELAVMDDDGRELPPGESGELWIRGPMVVPRYWDDEEATARGFVGGWWRSGDLGSIDAAGFVRVHDRIKDMLNRGGYKIYSVEVENVLAAHPAVAEAAVVGRPCPVLGERVHAFVCLKPGAAGDEADAGALRAFCATRLADYKVPETWSVGSAPLPRNANGKLLKRTLREGLDAGAPAGAA